MFRSLLFAIGIFLLILGAQTLVVDRWIVSGSSPLTTTDPGYYNGSTTPFRTAAWSNNRTGYAGNLPAVKRVYQTREWMPWSLLAAGSIIVLYNYSSGRGDAAG